MRWSSPEAPILQFELLRCTLDAGRADFSRDRRMQSGFFDEMLPSLATALTFRRGRAPKKARSSREAQPAPELACPAPAAKACCLALLQNERRHTGRWEERKRRPRLPHARGTRRYGPQKPKVVEEALLYAKPEIECVIAESPGLERILFWSPKLNKKSEELFDGTK